MESAKPIPALSSATPKLTALRPITEDGNSRAACPPVTGAATLILRHATVSFFPSPPGNPPSAEISNRQ
jgi:hypothetical protein